MIKNFIYLDSQKLRSISSQLFEGFTERVLEKRGTETEKSEQQSGVFASGRVLADIFSAEESVSNLKFLEDYAYTLFENHILKERILSEEIDYKEKNDVGKIVKVSSRILINDLAATATLLSDFNEVGEAIWRIGNTQPQNGNGVSKPTSASEVRKLAAKGGLQLDPFYAKAASRLIEFGFSGMLEARMVVDGRVYSSPLKRQFLRDNENLIVQKYSRYTQQNFSIVGIVTQAAGRSDDEDTLPDVKDGDGLKETMRILSLHMREVEKTFSGPSKAETVIDPIAIYTEI